MYNFCVELFQFEAVDVKNHSKLFMGEFLEMFLFQLRIIWTIATDYTSPHIAS
jgi:hypothetical protein